MYGQTSPEMMLTAALAQYGDWYVMRDVLIPFEDRTMHIDFMLVAPNCLFIGEFKTFQGIMTGQAMNKYWKQYVGSSEIDYFSPVMQNLYHVRAMQAFLAQIHYDVHIHAVTVMYALNKESRIQIQGPYPPDTSIVTDMNALRRITQVICEKKLMNLNPAETKFLYDYIGEHQLRGDDARDRHIRESTEYKLNARKALVQQICPECLSPLVPHGTPTGNYWVCSRYPDCQYHHKM